MRPTILALIILSTATALAALGCGGAGMSTTRLTSATTTTTTPVSGAGTFGQLADSGKTIFASRCAKCHGDNGQGITGPAVIGPSANLAKYQTAQGLLSFVAAAMPLDAPGSLSHQEYLQVVTFLLVQNNDASANDAFNESALGSLKLK